MPHTARGDSGGVTVRGGSGGSEVIEYGCCCSRALPSSLREKAASSLPEPVANASADGDEDDAIGLVRLRGANCCDDDSDTLPAALPPLAELSFSISSNTEANADWLTLAVILRRCAVIVADADAAAASVALSIAPPLSDARRLLAMEAPLLPLPLPLPLEWLPPDVPVADGAADDEAPKVSIGLDEYEASEPRRLRAV